MQMIKIFCLFLAILNCMTIVQSEIVYRLVGAVTQSSFEIKAKSSDAAQIDVYLNNTLYKSFSADQDNYYDISVSSLKSDSVYIVNLKKGNIDTIFNVTTFPNNTKNANGLSFIVSSNARTNTDSFIYNKILGKSPKFFMLLGNMHMESQKSTNWKDYEDSYINAVTLSATKTLYQNVPLVYMFNEGDFEGVSGSSAKSPNVNTINEVYRKMFPNYVLPAKGIYQSFRYGNSFFIMIDSRTFMEPDNKVFLGTTQVNYVLSQLKTAAENKNVGAIFICLTQVWNYVSSAYDWDMVKQNYNSILDFASADKKQIGDQVMSLYNFNRPTLPNFKSVMMIVGEHTNAFDDGTWNNFGNFPIAVCGPIDYWQQCRGGPYSHGSFHDSENNFCQFNIYYDAITTNTCIKAEGIIATDRAKRVDQTVWMYDTCQPEKFRGRVNLKCPIDYTEKIINACITIASAAFVFIIFFVLIYRLSLKAFGYSHLKQK